MAELSFRARQQIYVPGVGAATVLEVIRTPSSAVSVRLQAVLSESPFQVPESVLRVWRARNLASRSRLLRILEVGPAALPKSLRADAVVTPRPERLLAFLVASRLQAARTDLPIDEQVRNTVTDLLASELALAGRLELAEARNLVQEAVLRHTETSALARFQSEVAFYQSGLQREAVQRKFTPPPLLAPPEELFNLRPESLIAGKLVSWPLGQDPAEGVLARFARVIPQRGLRLRVPPFGLGLLVDSDDLDEQVDRLFDSLSQTFDLPLGINTGGLVFLALYPSGAIRTAFVRSDGPGRGVLEEPFALLDPDAEPSVMGAGSFMTILAGFEHAR